MSDCHERDQVLQRRISRAVLTDPEAAKRYHSDAATHLQVEVLRNVLLLADKAMEIEGVGREVRDRVAHWILMGEPPPGREKDPDAELDEAVREQTVMRTAWVWYLYGLPPSEEFLADLADPIRLAPKATPFRDKPRARER